jgi:hypothetical protein
MADSNMSKPALMVLTLVGAFALGWYFTQPSGETTIDEAAAAATAEAPANVDANTNRAPVNTNAGTARNQAPPPITQVPQRDDGSASSLEGLDLEDPQVQQDLDRLLQDRARQMQKQQAEQAVNEWRTQMPQAVAQVLSDLNMGNLTDDVVGVFEDMDTSRELFVEEDMADGEPDFEGFEEHQKQLIQDAEAELRDMLGDEGFEELQKRVPPGPVPPAPPGQEPPAEQ